jgi:O-antigen/teichoic acid export membrane protein
MLTFPIALGVTALADPIIALIYGKEFAVSADMLRGLIWTICLFPIAMIYARALVASKNQRLDLLCNVIAMLTNVGLNLALIPRYSQLGAVVATLISIVVFLLAQQYFVSRLLFTIPLAPALLKPLFAGALMGAFTYALREQNLFFVIAASGVVYLSLLLLLNTFSAEEKGMFRTVWEQKVKLVTLRG